RMIAQALDLIDSFLADILLKCRITWNHIAAKHEFLPHHDPQLIAYIVKILRLVIRATPCPHHIHVRVSRRLQNLPVSFGSHAIGKAVKRDYVRSLGKYGNSVYNECEALAPFVWHTPQLERTESRLEISSYDCLLSNINRDEKLISILCTIAYRVPK